MMVNKVEFKLTDNEDSYFIVTLKTSRIMEVPMWSFFNFVSDYDEKLAYYGGNFPEWEELTKDLVSLGYDFKSNMDKYIAQFTEEQIEDFSEDSSDYYSI